jgi:hypothetical protein
VAEIVIYHTHLPHGFTTRIYHIMPRKCLILLRINDLDALGGKSHPLRQ